ncbi:MAG: methyltransferase, partial [Nitrospinota bacterium]|nr:methyltransferase [Nitrospinota bacterium]
MKNNFRRAPGSFRDPESTVFFDGDRVHRRLSEEALRHWRDFRDSNAAAALYGDGALVETKEVEKEGQIFLEHARVPLISYPYEWSFGMMKDAAASTLGIVDKLLESGFILKDATPFNIQFTGHKPVFIDIGSIVKYEEASGWVGYAQFLETFLYPLMVASLRNTPFQPLIRGQIDGLPVEFMRSLFGWLDMFKPGVFADVLLRQAIGSRTTRRVGEVRRSSSSALRVPAESVVKNVRRLGRLVEKLRKNDEDSVWKDYMETRPYSETG